MLFMMISKYVTHVTNIVSKIIGFAEKKLSDTLEIESKFEIGTTYHVVDTLCFVSDLFCKIFKKVFHLFFLSFVYLQKFRTRNKLLTFPSHFASNCKSSKVDTIYQQHCTKNMI